MRYSKASVVVIGRVLKEVYNHGFDYVLYPLVLLKLGYWTGLSVMILFTGLENALMLVLYRYMKIDWLGYEYVYRVKAWSRTKTGVKQWLGRLLNRSNIILFVVLSTLRDSFETTAYFQPLLKSKAKMIFIFLLSVLVGNLYWSLGVEIFINSWLRTFFP